jgi:hypothetical protein
MERKLSDPESEEGNDGTSSPDLHRWPLRDEKKAPRGKRGSASLQTTTMYYEPDLPLLTFESTASRILVSTLFYKGTHPRIFSRADKVLYKRQQPIL